MYNVLIVDDEPGICRGLSMIIPWEEYNLKVAGTAANGRDALEKLKMGGYNLVITDIRMPVLDGLELIKRIREYNPQIKMIILSGYTDFSYAKRAIEYGVKGYLLKPIDRDDLIENVRKIKEELDDELREEKIRDMHVNILKDKFLYDLANGNLTNNEISEGNKVHGLGLDKDGCYSVALLEIGDFYGMVEKSLEDAKLMKFEVRNIAEEIIIKSSMGYVFEDEFGVLGVIFTWDDVEDTEGQTDNILKGIQKNTKMYLSLNIITGYGKVVDSLLDIKNSRKQAKYALEKSFIFRGNGIAPYSDIEINENLFWDTKWSSQELLNAVEEFDTGKVENEIAKMTDEIVKVNIPCDTVKFVIYDTLFQLIAVIRRHNGNIKRLFGDLSIKSLPDGNYAIDTFKQNMLDICYSAINYIKELVQSRPVRIIDQVLDYVDKNYASDLSVKNISGIFYMNPAYLGQLFKNTTGETFSNYLNKKRINEVKKMIIHDDCNISDILEKSGFNNSEYFYKQFRRYEGITFTEYKERKRGK